MKGKEEKKVKCNLCKQDILVKEFKKHRGLHHTCYMCGNNEFETKRKCLCSLSEEVAGVAEVDWQARCEKAESELARLKADSKTLHEIKHFIDYGNYKTDDINSLITEIKKILTAAQTLANSTRKEG